MSSPAPPLLNAKAFTPLRSSAPAQKSESNAESSFAPYKILYPIQQCATGQGEEAGTKWEGLSPLDLIEKILAGAEKSPAGRKRKSEDIDEAMPEASNEYANALVEAYGTVQLQDCDLTAWDIFPETDELLALGTLAKEFESTVAADPEKQWVVPSYNRVQQGLASHGNAAVATSQVKALMEMVSAEGQPAKEAAESLLALERSPTTRAKEIKTQKEKNDAFVKTMVLWLKSNFANPFLDEAMMRQLAHYMVVNVQCIEASAGDARILDIATEKINIWLTNQRTRKWRPSLVKAFNNKRPAVLLLEDAVQIYSDKPLRPIMHWNGAQALFKSDKEMEVNKQKRRAKGSKAKPVADHNKEDSKTEKLSTKAKVSLSPTSFMLSGAKQPPTFDLSPIGVNEPPTLGTPTLGASPFGGQTLPTALDVSPLRANSSPAKERPIALMDISPICDQIEELKVAEELVSFAAL